MRHLVCAAFAAFVSSQPTAAQADRRPEAFQIGLGLQQRGLHDEAAGYFEQFVAQQPQHELVAEAWYRLGTSRAESGQRPAAVKALQQALAQGGAGFALRAECRYRLGNLLEAAGDHQAAGQQFTALAREIAGDHYLLAAAWFAAGEAAREQRDDARAVEAFTQAVAAATGERASYRFPALYQLGFAQLRLNALGEAAATFAVAADAAPDDAGRGECRYLVGDLQLRLGEPARASAAFAAAAALGGEFADDAVLGLGFVALANSDQAAARSAFQRVLTEHAQSLLVGKARLELGRSLYGDGQYEPAAQMLQELLSPTVADELRQQAQELVGLCALASGAGDAALLALQQALRDAAPPDRPRLSFALGEAYSNLARWQEAVAAYDAVPAEADRELRGEALYGACFALHALGRHAESIAHAEALRALEPPHRLRAQAIYAVAENHFATGAYEAAESAYAALADEPTLRGGARWKLAWCRYLRGAHADAAQRFRAIAAETGSPFADEALSMQALAAFEAGDLDAALATADLYVARHANGAFLDRTERVAARVLRQRGDLGAARRRLERAADAAEAQQAVSDRAEQAELAYQQGDFAAADALFAALLEQPGALGARAAAGRAWCAFELGDDEACGRWLATAGALPASQDELPGLLELQSALAHRRAAWPDAVAAARAFLQRFPDHEKARALRYALGVAEARSGDSAAAVGTLGDLLRDGGYDRMDRVAYELAWARRRAGDEPGALAAFAEVAARTQDVELAGEARLHLGTAALAANDLGAARASLVGVQGSHRPTALYRLAFAEFDGAGGDLQKLAAARDLCDEVAAMNGGALAGESLYLGGECCHRLHDARGAAERLQRLLTSAPEHERAQAARLRLGECAVVLGDGALAVPPLEQFLRGEGVPVPEQARAHLWLGRARMLRSEFDRAEQSLQRATELSDTAVAAEAQFRLGESRLLRGDLPAAADAFVKLPILYGHAEWVRRGLLQAGLVYERMQQTDKAQRFFRELLQGHADSAEAKTAREHLRDG